MSKLTESEKAHEAERIELRIALLQWIESARTELDQLRECREQDPELDARARARGLREGISWGEEESSALIDLLADIGSHVNAIGSPAEPVAR